ncbi:hypothetical protein BKP35_08625 [Anaerobacillus arseniciselenatis]|uniref:Major facilitator superfamily (MFS) profile domain-containing protein n=1 Tax=Anaerobacillus arseniciselenatis TaxID=85682 RepID=A0A1S2LMX5_9BACI|nr:MFS transporter [Anaerobacillus arseniciselenatis]OIJ13831.1 hypothetical protein BKP35_08625 [Anaerobacillus arseniciselenatis]
MSKQSFYYGWVIVGVAFLMLFITSGIIMTFGVFVETMTGELSWSKTGISIGIAMFMLIQGLLSPYIGSLVDQYGPRKVISIGVLCLAIVVGLISTVSALWHFILLYGVLAALAYTTTTLVTGSALVARWFEKKRGLAIGITMSGFPLGPMVFSPFITYLVLTFGWRQSFILLGLIIGLVLFPIILFLVKDSPLSEEEQEAEKAKQSQMPPLKYRELIKQSPYLKLAGAYFTCGFTMSIISNHYHGHTVNEGFSLIIGSNTLALMAILAFAGTILSGYVSDFIGRNYVLSLVYFLRGAAFLTIAFAPNLTVLIIAAVLFGISWTSTGPLTSALSGQIWGVKQMGKVFGAIFLVHQIGASLGALLGGIIFDHTHSYFWLFILGGVLLFVGTALTYTVKEQNISNKNVKVSASS